MQNAGKRKKTSDMPSYRALYKSRPINPQSCYVMFCHATATYTTCLAVKVLDGLEQTNVVLQESTRNIKKTMAGSDPRMSEAGRNVAKAKRTPFTNSVKAPGGLKIP